LIAFPPSPPPLSPLLWCTLFIRFSFPNVSFFLPDDPPLDFAHSLSWVPVRPLRSLPHFRLAIFLCFLIRKPLIAYRILSKVGALFFFLFFPRIPPFCLFINLVPSTRCELYEVLRVVSKILPSRSFPSAFFLPFCSLPSTLFATL